MGRTSGVYHRSLASGPCSSGSAQIPRVCRAPNTHRSWIPWTLHSLTHPEEERMDEARRLPRLFSRVTHTSNSVYPYENVYFVDFSKARKTSRAPDRY
jgi:hypothetical protein